MHETDRQTFADLFPSFLSRLLQQRNAQTFLRVVTWALPLILFSIAAGLELAEEFVLENYSWYVKIHFIFETIFFGVVGPLAVFFVLVYIRRLLEREYALMADLERLNRDLEARVTERTIELAERNQQLEDANRQLRQLDEMKSEFVSLVSHELRAPLTALNGGLELALQNAESLPPDSRRILQTMVEESNRLTEFVQTILDVSRLEAGRVDFNLGPVAVAPVLHRAADVVLDDRRQVKWHLPAEVPPVWADEIHYEEILRNLLRNADKYSPIELPVEIYVSVGAENVSVSIADHGVGIPPEMFDKIFERFQRGQRGENTPPGWGLGLYFARKLTEAQGGRLTLRSPRWDDALAPGAEFTVTMPLAADAPEGKDA